MNSLLHNTDESNEVYIKWWSRRCILLSVSSWDWFDDHIVARLTDYIYSCSVEFGQKWDEGQQQICPVSELGWILKIQNFMSAWLLVFGDPGSLALLWGQIASLTGSLGSPLLYVTETAETTNVSDVCVVCVCSSLIILHTQACTYNTYHTYNKCGHELKLKSAS